MALPQADTLAESKLTEQTGGVTARQSYHTIIIIEYFNELIILYLIMIL